MSDLLEQSADDERFAFDLLLAVFHNLPDAVLITDERRNILKINPQAQLLFGYHESELIGQPIEILVPDAIRERHRSHTEKYIGNPSVRPMGHGLDLKARRKNGEELSVEINLSPVSTIRGVHVIAVIRRK